MKNFNQKLRARISTLLHSYFDDRPIQWAVVKYSLLAMLAMFSLVVSITNAFLYILALFAGGLGESFEEDNGAEQEQLGFDAIEYHRNLDS